MPRSGKPKKSAVLSLPDEGIQRKVYDHVSGAMNDLLDKPLSKNEFNSGMGTLREQATTDLFLPMKHQ